MAGWPGGVAPAGQVEQGPVTKETPTSGSGGRVDTASNPGGVGPSSNPIK